MRKTLVGTATAIMLTTSFTGTALGATHEVKPGDSLWKIASKYQTSVSQLKDWNHLKSDLIYPKQVIIVTPDEAKKPQTQKPKANSTNGNKQAAPSTSAKTYVVVSGDSLFNIAIKHNISLADLVAWNGLKGDLIHPGQVLKVSNSSATVKPNGSSNESSNQTSQKTDTYKVVSGDTLSGIAARYGTTVSKLKSLNGLSSDFLQVGQVLKVNASSSATPEKSQTKPSQGKNTNTGSSSKTEATNAAKLISTAKGVLGSPYAWGGTSPSGFDCSGFIYYAFSQSGHNVPRTSSEGYYDRSYYVKDPQPGDLVFFRDTYKPGISHMGIYLGNGDFIHANDKGVNIINLSNPYWKSKFDGYKRFY